MNRLINIISNILSLYIENEKLAVEPTVTLAQKPEYGHVTTNLALVLASKTKTNPLAIAKAIKSFIEANYSDQFAKIEIMKPGFINFTFKPEIMQPIITDILTAKENYGKSQSKNEKYNLEIVSANPTGYLHIGHARNGAIGDSVARILKFAGYDVVVEYYTNDAGRQINILAVTVFVNYLRLLGKKAAFPDDCYHGEMYAEVASKFVDKYHDQFINVGYGDEYIEDEKVHQIFRKEATADFLKIIKEQLKRFRVNIEYYISEQSAYDTHQIDQLLADYRRLNAIYEKDGATWLKTTTYGDDKDRVLIKSDGNYTYITPDLASHREKINRTHADKLINFWGGDHHGYIKRMQAGLSLLGYKKDLLEIIMIQMVRVIKDGQEFKMSKRKGTAIWLTDILDLIGVDATRYILSSKTPDSHMDIDISLLKENSSKNPVFYVQYAVARGHSVLKIAHKHELVPATKSYNQLVTAAEQDLLLTLDQFNYNLERAAKYRAPNILCDYIQTVAKKFHVFYNQCKIIDTDNKVISQQRLALVEATIQVLTNALNLIAVSAPEHM